MKATKLVFGIFVFVSWALLVALFIVGLRGVDAKNTGTSAAGNPQIAAGNGIILSASEVAKHASAGDCWTIISGKVYDVTKYAGAHPGGASRILEICGTDGTALFSTMGGQGQHSSFASSLLDSFYLGNLNQNITQSALQNASQKIENATIPAGGRGGREWEYEDD